MKESITRWHERIRALLIVCVELNQKLPRRPAPLFEISWSISVGPFTACPCATTLRHCRPNAIAENEADDHQKFHFLWPKKGPGAEGNVCRVASFLFSQSAKLTNVSVEEIGRNYFIRAQAGRIQNLLQRESRSPVAQWQHSRGKIWRTAARPCCS
jgi:hypothetical protein